MTTLVLIIVILVISGAATTAKILSNREKINRSINSLSEHHKWFVYMFPTNEYKRIYNKIARSHNEIRVLNSCIHEIDELLEEPNNPVRELLLQERLNIEDKIEHLREDAARYRSELTMMESMKVLEKRLW